MTATSAVRRARTLLAPYVRTAVATVDWHYLREQAGPVLLHAGRGQVSMWKAAGWATLLLRGAPVPLVALAAVHLVLALMLRSVLPLPSGPRADLLLCLVVVAVALGLVAAGPMPAAPDTRWWSEGALVAALLDAGVLPTPRKDDPPPMLSRCGQPTHDARGTSVVIALPAGRTAADVCAAHLRLSGSLGIPPERLRVAHVEGKPANVVRLTELAPRRSGSLPAEVGAAERTCWADPVRVGETEDGSAVRLDTFEANTLLAGIPGSGKSSIARVILAHYLLSPDTKVFGLDGKGSRLDYSAAVPLAVRWVWGTSDDAVEQLEEMLRDVLAIVRERNASDRADRWPGVLVTLEELQDVRASADKAGRERLDNLLGRVVRMGRAVSVSVLVSTQRPSVDDLPSGVRNLVSQRLALQLRNGQDAALVLGTVPALPLPARRGEALLTTPAGTRAVRLDLLDDAAWTALCARATALRCDDTSEGPAPVTEALAEAHSEPLPPLLAACADVVSAAGPEGVGATALLALLAPEVRPGSVVQLGKALGTRPDVFVQRREMPAGHRRWHLSADLSAPVGDLSTAPSGAVGTCQDSTGTGNYPPAPPLPSAPVRAVLDDDPLTWRRLPRRTDDLMES